MKTYCIFYHSEEICEKFLTADCSEPKLCSNRHPKECKYWMGDTRGCLNGQECKYLRRAENRGKSIRALNNKDKVTKNKEYQPNSDQQKNI